MTTSGANFFRAWLGLLAFCLPLSLSAAAVELKLNDLSGDYEDGGTTAEDNAASPNFEPSLAALLRLEFDQRLAGVRHDETARVRVAQSPGALAIEIFDKENAVVWKGRWEEGSGYVRRGAAIVLRFQTGTTIADEVFLSLEPVAENRLLQVTVQCVQSTLLGPGVTQRGVYLFSRVP